MPRVKTVVAHSYAHASLASRVMERTVLILTNVPVAHTLAASMRFATIILALTPVPVLLGIWIMGHTA